MSGRRDENRVTGTHRNDRLFTNCRSNDFSNLLKGGPGRDRLEDACDESTQYGGKGEVSLGGDEGSFYGQDGDDMLRGGGNKTLVGGSGLDIASYRRSRADRIQADLGSNRTTSFYEASSAVDVLIDIEGVFGSRGPL